jgi:hypothetical protein
VYRQTQTISFDKTWKMTRSRVLLLLLVFVAAGTCFPSRCLAMKGGIHIQTHRLMEGFMKYVVELGSGAMIYRTYQVS